MNNLKPPFIIVVDDDSDDFVILEDFMNSRWPYLKLIHYHDSAVFLKAIADIEIPSLVILDVNIPKHDGFNVCEALKASRKWKDVPIVFLSTSDSKSHIEKGKALGAYAYLVKPTTEEQWTAIAKAIHQASTDYRADGL
jgi:DNA-binding response OmpR family regulator